MLKQVSQQEFLNADAELPLYNPSEDRVPLANPTDKKDAFYGTAINGSDEPLQDYYERIDELNATGDSMVLNALRSQYQQKKDLDRAVFIENLVIDPGFSKKEKQYILDKQLKLNDPAQASLRSFYLETLQAKELEENPVMTDKEIDGLAYKIHNYKTKDDFLTSLGYVNDIVTGKTPPPDADPNKKLDGTTFDQVMESIYDPVMAEPLALFNTLIVGLAPYISELVYTGYTYATDDEIQSVTEARNKARKVINESWGEDLYDAFFYVANALGVEREDIEDAWVTQGFTKLDEGLTWAATKISPDDVEKAKIPLEILTAFAIPIFRKGKKLSQDAYLRITDPNAYQVVKLLESKPEFKPDIPFKDDISTRTIEDLGIEVPRSSPLIEAINSNKSTAQQMSRIFMEDTTNQAARAMRMTVESFIGLLMMPKFLRDPLQGESFDATPGFKALKLEQNEIARDFVLNPYFKDYEARYSWMEENAGVYTDIVNNTPIQMAPSQTTLPIVSNGTQIKMSLAFNKDGFAYTNIVEAHQAGLALQAKVKRLNEAEGTDGGKVFMEALDDAGNPLYKVPIKDELPSILTDIKMYGTARYQIRWERTGDFFDEVRSLADDFGKMPWEKDTNLNWLGRVATKGREFIFDNPKGYNWLAVFGKSDKRLERRWTMSHQFAERAAKRQLEVLSTFMYDKSLLGIKMASKKFRQDLKTLMESSRDKADLFSVNEIYQVLDYSPDIRHVKALQDTLALMRQIDRFSYQLLNAKTINDFVAKGYKDYIDISRVDGNKQRLMVQDVFQFPINKETGEISLKVLWDAEHQQPFTWNPHAANNKNIPVEQFLYQNDMPIRKIVKLAKPYVDSNGNRYNYSILPKGQKLTGVPDWIVPTKTGHFTRISEGTFFVKAFPKRVTIDGITTTAAVGTMAWDNPILNQNSKTVAMFKTQTEAKAWMERNRDAVPEMDSTRFDFDIRKADELVHDDNLQINLIRNAIARPAKASNENIYNGIYADPLESFILSTQRLGSDAFMQPVIEQMQLAWLNHYKSKVNLKEGTEVYPTNRASIESVPGKERIHRQALAEFDRMDSILQGHSGQMWARYLSMVADKLGSATDAPMTLAASKFFRKWERNPNVVMDAPRRYVTTFKITLAALWRNLTLQPIGIFGPMIVGPATMSTFMNTVGTLHAKLLQSKGIEGKYAKYNPELFKYAYEQGRMERSLGIESSKLTLKDHQYIIKYIEDVGHGITGEHYFAKGIFSHKVDTLAGGTTFGRLANKALSTYGKYGFEAGEYMNRVGMWHAARSLWVKNNPGKNWRSKAAMNEITFDANQLAGSMIKENTYAFQRVPLLQYIGQFQAFGMKASESIWNKGASPYSPTQRAMLQAYNLAVFGVRGGLVYGLGELIMDWLNSSGNEDMAKLVDDAALTRLVINRAADTLFPTYDKDGDLIESSADIAAVYSPFGTEAGGVYRSYWKALARMLGAEIPNYQLGPATRTAVQAIDTYKLINSMFGEHPEVGFNEKLKASVVQLARLTSGGSSLWNTFMYTKMNEKISRLGQATGSPVSDWDVFLTAFSVPNDKDRIFFETKFALKDEKEKIADLAKSWWESGLVLHGYDLTFGQITDVFKTANFVAEFTDNQKEMFWEELIKLDNQSKKSRLKSLFNDILERRRIHANPKYSDEERQAMKAFIELAPNSEYKRNLEILFNEIKDLKED